MEKDKKFNLIDEPWIKVLTPDNKVVEVSLTEVICNAQKYKELKGDVATQDVPILRLLLAILYSIFSKVNSKGEQFEIKTEDDALDIWNELWKAKKFPEEPIKRYLEKWHDRFWLFHPERPFWQANNAEIGTQYGASKLNGAISESNNKIRLFSLYSGEYKNVLPYAAAARWLLHVNAFDDTSAKSSQPLRQKAKAEGFDILSPGAGWLGKLGLIFAEGNNLFETLMFNLTMLQNGTKLWEPGKAIWEEETVRSKERNQIDLPQNLAQLYTLQSRRLLLKRNDFGVNEYFLLGGDFFDKANPISEQMTIWRPIPKDGKNKNEIIGWQPKRHDPSKQFWRDFSDVFVTESNKTQPGIVNWIAKLTKENILERNQKLHFKIASVQYGDKDFFVTDLFQDSINFSADIISEIGRKWQKLIENEIALCDKLANALSDFAIQIEKAAGNSNENNKIGSAKQIKEIFYHQLDLPFKKWISEIEPNCADKEQSKRLEWRDIARQIVLKLGDDLYKKSGSNAFVGRTISDDSKKGSKRYSSPEAYKWFKINIGKIYSN
ncbi:MAG: CRISPR-associated protein CasA/Cse1 [bacterium ADurb.Bin157]|nr:MAG: CRISPR-associated protein CasA/Cse1 [bacterium ADurb.Bin157]